jgi:CubicO group peptidase (beta-lactamase class C family)
MRIAILRFAFIALLPTLCFSQNPSQQNGITRRINEYLNRATESGLFSGTVAVAKDGKILFSRGYGMADLAYDVSNGPETRFDIGSVSKTFTAALVLRLQDTGKLRLDDPICKYLDNCAEAWHPITIRHLLTHTSGLLNYTELPDYFEKRALDSFLPNAMERIRSMPLQFPPGDRFAYSNTGYKLLHEIVQKVSGQAYEDFLRSTILDVLGMKNTGFLENPNIRHVIVKNLATGYTDGVGPLELAPWVHANSGGGMYSTPEDMCLWAQALLAGKLLSAQSLADAFRPGRGDYGFGWFVFKNGKHPFATHSGNIPGFGVTLVLYFDEKLSIFVASNLDTAPTNRIQDDIAKIIFGESYQLPPVWRSVAVDHKIYDGYVGRYRKTDQPNFVITIKKENGQLWNRLGDDPGAAEMVLRPLSETRFFNKMFVLYEVTFVLGAEGRATRLVADGPWGRGEFVRIDQPSNAGEQK